MVFKEIILIKVTLIIGKNLRKGDNNEEKSVGITMAVFLLGIFMGAIDSGIVSPARDIIADGLKVSQNASVWVVTIYTLAYAVSMPLMGKLSDKYGRKSLHGFNNSIWTRFFTMWSIRLRK